MMNSIATSRSSSVACLRRQRTTLNNQPQRLQGRKKVASVERRQRLVCRAEGASVIDQVQTFVKVFQESKAEGSDFKQAVADAIAGEYDREATTEEVQQLASSAPLVLFTWEASPACKKALKYLEVAGAEAKIVRLDDPWEEGNPKRAALGRLTGKSSVPSVWINGVYIGGCDDGPTDEAPGLVPLAFQGKLLPMLEAAGAVKGVPSGDKSPEATETVEA
mmetsp:Transcript_13966/g.16870  ORF Transcript_13966/g.16870 Transcript_13966/m.16870 type:complete len:220 (-) Transcript_13966:463-1122(-)|eukprot:CAMPEP_0197849232 /NCGR_PEP_ID=MMETSP1438-20131217/11334_1 /TAXON_ID=1461541 /ORGANISM="Pterosperma sp., Strain CCMP1384" /LENGTH=219 /DNA_ID=CAMNT_0043461817 /DNA_START=87 /DNA_END=746 /DNA_ORIENTATION=-